MYTLPSAQLEVRGVRRRRHRGRARRRFFATPTPYTLHPTPYTLHPTSYILHPTPCTLHPTPYPLTCDALGWQVSGG